MSGPTTASAAARCPSGQPCVVVHVVGEDPSTQVFSIADLDDLVDVSDADYGVRVSTSSSTTSERIGRGVSLAGLIGALDSPLASGSVNGTSVTRRDGTGSDLRRGDLDDPPPFADDLVPVIYVVGSDDAIGYLRPLRGADDANGRDYFQTFSDEALDLYVYTRGKPLAVALTAAPDAVKASEPVTFRATTDADAGVRLTYAWSFGDRLAPYADGATARHPYAAQGTYRAHVVVTGSDGSTGRSDDVVVAVGVAPPGPGLGDGDGTGGAGDGDGKNDSPNAPTTGPRDSAGERAGGTPSATPQDGAAARDGKPSPAAADPSDATEPARTTGPQISGILLAGADSVSAPLTPSQLTPEVLAATAPAARSDGAPSLGAGVAGVVGVLLLLALGAARESSTIHRRLHHLRSRHER